VEGSGLSYYCRLPKSIESTEGDDYNVYLFGFSYVTVLKGKRRMLSNHNPVASSTSSEEHSVVTAPETGEKCSGIEGCEIGKG